MKNRELQDLKKDKNIAPEDVARFSLYENDLNDSSKFTAICDLVVCCENSQTTPLKQQIKELEAERDKYRKALERIKDTSYDSEENNDVWHDEIAEQALNSKEVGNEG